MEDKKKRMNPWVPVVIMGVIAILFSFYSLQSQAELVDARKEIDRLNTLVVDCRKEAEAQTEAASRAAERANVLLHEAERKLSEALKAAKKK